MVSQPSILLAVDPVDPPAQQAAVETLALATGWPLVLLNAVPHGATGETVDVADRRLAEWGETFAGSGLDVRTQVLVGPPVDVIMAEAEAVHAAVIVVGGHREQVNRRPILGSVASALLKVTDRPVLVIPRAPGPTCAGFIAAVERLVDLIDRSDDSAHCLADLRDAAVRVPSDPSPINHRRLGRRLRKTLHEFETDHPSLTAAINDVAYHLSGMGI